MPEVIEPPVTEKTELPNPVLPSDMELSKSIFNLEMEKVKPEPEKPVEVPGQQKAVEVAKPEEKPVEVKVDAKQPFPEELLTGKKEEPKVDESIAQIDAMALPKNAKPEQVASFAKLKEQSIKTIQAAHARVAELESKTSDGANKAEIEAAQARVKTAENRAKELEETVERIAFTESPKFKAFVGDEAASLDGAKAYLEGSDVDPGIIELAARAVGQKRIQVLRDSGLDVDMIAAVSPYLAQYDSIQRSKTAALENWKSESAAWQQGQKAKEEAQQVQLKADEDRIWSDVIKEAENDFLPYRKVKDNAQWNAQSDELKTGAKQIYNGDGVDLKTVATTIAKGKAYDVLNDVLQNVIAQLNDTRSENARLKAARPDGGSGQGTPLKAEENMTDDERRKQSFNRELAAARGS